MKIVRFSQAGKIQSGILTDKTIAVIEGDALGSLKKTGATVGLADVKLLAPIVPVNILCFGQNYKAHAERRRERDSQGTAALHQGDHRAERSRR